MILILVANCRSCREARFEACQLAGSPPVQWRAGPECLRAEEVERAGHICVVETGFGQASIACAPGAVAGGLVHGAFDAGAAGVVGVEGDAVFGGAGGGGPGPACQVARGRCISSATRRSPMPKPAELHRGASFGRTGERDLPAVQVQATCGRTEPNSSRSFVDLQRHHLRCVGRHDESSSVVAAEDGVMHQRQRQRHQRGQAPLGSFVGPRHSTGWNSAGYQ